MDSRTLQVFMTKLLAVAGARQKPEHYQMMYDYYACIFAKADIEAKEYIDYGKPIRPEIQLLFNLEEILDNVYTRAKEDVKLEILTQLEYEKTTLSVEEELAAEEPI